METVTLWRPTGPEELALEYATMIARDWNVKASGAGFVTRFQLRKNFIDRYEVQQAGGKTVLEYWIPAEDLPGLNANIVGTIHVASEFVRTFVSHFAGRRMPTGTGRGVNWSL